MNLSVSLKGKSSLYLWKALEPGQSWISLMRSALVHVLLRWGFCLVYALGDALLTSYSNDNYYFLAFPVSVCMEKLRESDRTERSRDLSLFVKNVQKYALCRSCQDWEKHGVFHQHARKWMDGRCFLRIDNGESEAYIRRPKFPISNKALGSKIVLICR